MRWSFFLCFCATVLFAEEPLPTKLKNGLIFGVGGSYNSITIDQQIKGSSFSSIFSGASLVALGESGGTANPYHETHSTLAPQAQLGYLHRFSNSSWFLGCKAIYQYLGLTFTENTLDSFPNGAYTVVGEGDDVWVGHFLISSSQTQINHELLFLPLFGYFFNDSSVYFGVGAALFGTENNLYGVKGLAQVNGASVDVIGSSPNLSFSEWIWGAVAQIGWIYPFSSSWFLDLNYSYAATATATFQNSTLFSHSLITGSLYTEEGIASLKLKERITAQSFTITINKVF
jgi:hypothetical protein